MDQPTPARDKRIATNLVALSSAAVLTVYTAGYLRTRSAAQRFANESGPRRASAPVELSTSAPAEWVSAAPDATSAAPRDAVAPPAPRDVVPDASPRPGTAVPSSASSSTPVADVVPASSVASASPVASASASAPVLDVQPASAPVAAPVAAAVALASAPPAPVPAAPAAAVLKDGTYLGWGTCRHGDIQAQVVIAAGRISSASISQCWTRYPCSWIGMLPGQVVARQSPNVDYVSGATQSTNAFYDAIVEALAKAK